MDDGTHRLCQHDSRLALEKFPFDKLVKFYDFDQINEAFEDSEKGITIKPILKISEA